MLTEDSKNTPSADNSPQRRRLSPLEEKIFCMVAKELIQAGIKQHNVRELADRGDLIGALTLSLTDSIVKRQNLC
jgi:hypothetical protein